MLKNLIKNIANNRDTKISKFIANFSQLYLDHHNNCLADIYTSGEVDILRVLSKRVNFNTIFDIGANVGNWTLEANRHCPGAKIHSFEIIPDVYKKLQRNTANLTNKVLINNFGISEEQGELEVNAYKDTGLTSTLDLSDIHKGEESNRVKIYLKKGDVYCTENEIKKIDFLKVDVEGAELTVLKSFKDLFEKRNIRIVQFEFGLGNVCSRSYLKDFYDYFTASEYLIARIFRRKVEFMEYSPHFEFIGHRNYLMVHASEKEVLDALKTPLL